MSDLREVFRATTAPEIEYLRECGRSRVAAGLPQFPPAGLGDLEEILSLRSQLAALRDLKD